MRKTLIAVACLLGSLVVAAGVPAATAQPGPRVAITPVAGKVVPGEYIVTTRPGTAHEVSGNQLAGAAKHVYDGAIHGFAASLTPAQLAALQRDPDVVAIEPNQVVSIDSATAGSGAAAAAGGAVATDGAGVQVVQSPTPNWGLDRIDQRTLPLTNSYTYFNSGLGVTAYVIDTGILVTHPEFGSRAAVAYDALGGNGIDCNGHGTHLSGIIGSTTYGVAKRVQLRAVRVLSCTGSGSFADVIEGVDWVFVHSTGPSVAIMALGGLESPAMDAAVSNLAASSVFVAVSAGSSASDACGFSPAGAPGAYAVIRTTQTDQSPTTNNFGPCVQMQAPGTLITSTWLNNTTISLSGTAMATAHVAGVAALFKDAVGETPSPVVGAWISGVATAGVLTGVHPLSPNLLLYTNVI